MNPYSSWSTSSALSSHFSQEIHLRRGNIDPNNISLQQGGTIVASETTLCLTFMKHPSQDKWSSAWGCTIPFSDLRLKAFLTLPWKTL